MWIRRVTVLFGQAQVETYLFVGLVPLSLTTLCSVIMESENKTTKIGYTLRGTPSNP